MSAGVTEVSGLAVPFLRDNVDTDALAPAAPMKAAGLTRTGLGAILLHSYRTRPDGTRDPGFVLNQPLYEGAPILVAGENFGCGSSREHAVWALVECGFRAVIALGFAEIFEQNATTNGLIPAAVAPGVHARLRDALAARPAATVTVELASRRILVDGVAIGEFAIDEVGAEMIMQGADEIALTAGYRAEIAEAARALAARHPWLDRDAEAAPRAG